MLASCGWVGIGDGHSGAIESSEVGTSVQGARPSLLLQVNLSFM